MSKKVIALTIGVAVVGIGIGVIIGYFSHPGNRSTNDESSTNSYFRDLDPEVLTKFVNDVQPENIRSNLM